MMQEADIETIYELSPLQQGMLYHSLYAPDTGVYVVQWSVRLEGALDLPAFREAWQRVVDRHAVLRTSFHWEGMQKPVQVVFRGLRVALEQASWQALDAVAQKARLEDHLVGERERGFELTEAPLMRLGLFALGGDAWRFVWTFHHLLFDGWSMGLILREVFTAYGALSRGESLDWPHPRPFQEYIAWLQDQDPEAARRFWQESLGDLEEIPRLEMGRPAADLTTEHRHYAHTEVRIAPGEAESIDRMVRRNRLTLYAAVQGAWALLLSRYCGRDDVVFGSTVSGRPAEIPAVETMVGLFINTLPMRFRVESEKPLAAWLGDIQELLAEMRQHEHTPLERVRQWSGAATGGELFDHILVFENFPRDAQLGQEIEGIGAGAMESWEQTHYPLTVTVVPGAELELRLSYDKRRFEDSTIDRLLQHFRGLLRGFAESDEQLLGQIPMLTPGEQQALLVEWNDTAQSRPVEARIDDLFDFTSETRAHRVALVEGNHHLSFAELGRRRDAVAARLRAAGAGPEVAVGLCVERGVGMVIGLLGILGAGAAYVPLDPAYPRRRLRFMLEDSRAPLLLTEEALADRLPEERPQTLFLQEEIARAGRSLGAPVAAHRAEHPAYIIYTSGSTGRPKGVVVPHGPVANFLRSMSREPGLDAGDTLLAVTTLSFDIAVLELLLPLVVGARLELAGRDEAAEGQRLAERLERSRITTLQATPVTWRLLLGTETGPLEGLKALSGGEALPRDLAQALRGLGAQLWNVYGPTETTIWSSVRRVGTRSGSVSIGRAIANTELHLVNRHLEPVPVGGLGQLYIAGQGLVRGYLRRPGRTAEAFVPHPFSEIPGERLYRTGDLARRRPDGTLEVLGRLDQQVKVRGVRMELGEIETVLRSHEGVRSAVVVVREDIPGDHRLVAYLVAKEGMNAEVESLRQQVGRDLPSTMVPSLFVFLDALPLTPNGKIHRKALPAPTADGSGVAEPARTPIESLVSGIFAAVLGLDGVPVQQSFFTLGGHSLLATQLVSRLRETFSVELSVRDVLEAPTVQDLAAKVEGATRAGAPPSRRVIEPLEAGEARPLSFAQERLWFVEDLGFGRGGAYNIPLAIELKGPLQIGALAEALSAVVRRHAVLRTTFPKAEGLPRLVLAEPWRLDLPQVDLSSLPATRHGALAEKLTQAEARRPFDLAGGPLLRATLVAFGAKNHRLLVTMHHMISDGWSLGVFLREVIAGYEAQLAGAPAAYPPLPVQYHDFAAWQRSWLKGPLLEVQLDYWRQHLEGAPELLTLPLDRPRPAVRRLAGARVERRLPEVLSKDLVALGRQNDATLFMTLIAAFAILLRRHGAQEDFVLGTDIANRNRGEIENLIGFFVNNLALRMDLRGDPTFLELLERTREVALGAYAHQDLPLEKVLEDLRLERSLSHAPLFQVLFVLQNIPQGVLEVRDLEMRPLDVDQGASKFDLVVTVQESEDGLRLDWTYSLDLFDEITITRLADRYRVVLEQLVEQPDLRVAELEIQTVQDKERETMEKQQQETLGFGGFRRGARRGANLEPVVDRLEETWATAFTMVQPNQGDVDLVGWAAGNRERIETWLDRSGAVLFRGFGIADGEEFERFATTLCGELFIDYGDLPYSPARGRIYNATPYPPDQRILYHNESSHMDRWPMKQLFFCSQPAAEGGETPIADCRRVYERLDPTLRNLFREKGVMYVRNFTPGIDVSWQDFFRTEDRSVVEASLEEAGMEAEWRSNGGLRTRRRCPAVLRHPRNQSLVFFNQIQAHHISCLESGVQESLRSLFGEGGLPRNVYFGDGSVIEDAMMQEIIQVYEETAAAFSWQKGDILMVDNMLVAHARNAFRGEREILVAMGEVITEDQVARA